MNEETAQGLLKQMQANMQMMTDIKANYDCQLTLKLLTNWNLSINKRLDALELVQAPIEQPHDDTTTTDALRRARRQSRSMPIKGSLLDASMMSDKDLLGNSVDDKLPDVSDDADKTTNTTNGYTDTYTGILWANANAFISDNNNNKTNEERRRERERGKNKTPIVSTMITGTNLARCSELRRRRRSRSQLRAS